MMLFSSLLHSLPIIDWRPRLQDLWQAITNQLSQRRKLIILLVAFLCPTTPAQAHLFTPLIEALLPNSYTVDRPKNEATNDAVNNEILNNLIISQPLTPTLKPEPTSPSLYALLDAEFAADRGRTDRALAIYKQQSFNDNATAVFERALSLSLRYEDVDSSLHFAQAWQQQNPDHIPAWFYVAHLALKAHDYALAGDTLNRILIYDPRADLSEILIGIYPNDDSDKRELLAALQPIDSKENASLSVLKAGLLFQFNEPKLALVHINRALAQEPDYVPFITLKADILRKTDSAETVLNYISQARLRNANNKSLTLYEIRYLLDIKQSKQAWELLLETQKRFNDDAEITLLAALVSLDVKQYRSADQLLNILAKSPAYLNQAYYYLGISAERQQRFEQAKYYLNGVMSEDLVLAARKKVIDLELINGNTEAAIATLEKLRVQFDTFAPESYVIQADILRPQDAKAALELLTRASRKYPDSEIILFARTQLLDDRNDYAVKRVLLNHLQMLNPTNLAYQLNYAQLLLANNRNSIQGLQLATTIMQIRYDDPRYDNDLHLQALNVLASNALNNDNYAQVIEYLQTPYDVIPTLESGILLLRAYQGLDDDEKVELLLADLQQRFAFGQQNINDRIQIY